MPSGETHETLAGRPRAAMVQHATAQTARPRKKGDTGPPGCEGLGMLDGTSNLRRYEPTASGPPSPPNSEMIGGAVLSYE
jgi:hypothetical protein